MEIGSDSEVLDVIEAAMAGVVVGGPMTEGMREAVGRP